MRMMGSARHGIYPRLNVICLLAKVCSEKDSRARHSFFRHSKADDPRGYSLFYVISSGVRLLKHHLIAHYLLRQIPNSEWRAITANEADMQYLFFSS